MKEVVVGDTAYRLTADQRDGRWIAHAERSDDGRRFGIECAGETETGATARLAAWLEWQHEHAAALDALQHAERDYHRTLAGAAFANPSEGPSPIEIQKESLEALEAARVRLDEIRARKPE
jgi:hypothetical protein